MFNLIMRSVPWNTESGTMPIGRLFEYTEGTIADQFRESGAPALERLARLPCLFMPEGIRAETSYVGSITRLRIVNRELIFDYALDREVPPLENRLIYANRQSLDMPDDFEFSRNHWAVKDKDLYRFILRSVRSRRQNPSVFHIEEQERIEPALVSAMMPFDAGFDPVYESIQKAAELVSILCRRADEFWYHAMIFQDVVSLIDRSRIVICYCTGRNPNVFYEAGIAHTLGREVILITQSEQDIPFDLRHHRHIRYLNNAEGRTELTAALQARMKTILGR